MITLGRRSVVRSEIDRSKIFQSCCEKSWMVLDLIKDNFSMLEEGSSEGSKEGNDSELHAGVDDRMQT
jgi:hypothetical protein